MSLIFLHALARVMNWLVCIHVSAQPTMPIIIMMYSYVLFSFVNTYQVDTPGCQVATDCYCNHFYAFLLLHCDMIDTACLSCMQALCFRIIIMLIIYYCMRDSQIMTACNQKDKTALQLQG